MRLPTFARLMLTLTALCFSFLIAEFALVDASEKFVEPQAGIFTNHQAAASVLDQPDFTTNTAGSTASKFNRPENAVVDPVSNKVFVIELNNNRVVRFTSAAAMTSGATAEAVLGQPDFATVTSGTTQSKLKLPQGLATDSNNRLYVADFNNSRVLIFNNAGTAANGAPAAVILGQPDFTTGTANTGGISAVSMFNPVSMTYDQNSNSLFVADYSNNRVLRFAAMSPTAASVSVSGRVLTGSGSGLANAVVYLTDSEGNARSARTGSFGYYRFEGLPAGQTVVVTVVSKRFQFTPQVLALYEDVTELNFAAAE